MPTKFRPVVESLEARDVPAVVTVTKIADAAEGGAAGVFRFTRTGSTTDALTVNYSVGGTATAEADYTLFEPPVVFAAGQSTADVTVTALADAVYDPDETVTVTLTSGGGYTVGTPGSATLTIQDDPDTVETLIHDQTFQLASTNGNVNVHLTVTYNAPGAPGVYTWAYTVTNPSGNASALTTFSVPVSGSTGDVANAASTAGWTGTIGASAVSWAAGTALAPGASATFTFATAPREVA
ncbi:MAG: hypothetical protein K2V38_04290, partial [Gemmataceae bacterium]|nr:hypothetical protein [Gemmataceae bacterium]